ncbi:haloacid dehalogenase type II [Phytoactinopolyspora alkaliphila]|uniref:Haloacid dehalogenase type II n=1 Tax=Phytoactinopolyspora alkaliphila TaxID=1783498 RepID=A0A6N9YH45_9ACTN|nr:haloacid dehalogenase type II [Phytoactinopolyspora alkaliphila]NED94381.1 haloacid dehalogenase type II [Phytoactinopolyspora alkaliphila]
MPSYADIDLVVFDILGTLVNEPGGLHDSIRELAPDSSAGDVGGLVEMWQNYVADEQQKMLDRGRPYANSDAVDREAAELIAARCGVTDATAVDRLATAERRLDPWPDTVEALERIARHLPVVGLSNASRATLTGLNLHAGLRWHYVLSAEDAQSYKPAPDVYRLAVDLTGGTPERVLMVAAHAWDLRGAQALGLRTAYVRRPVGDPPRATDAFDYRADSLADLAAVLLGRQHARVP